MTEAPEPAPLPATVAANAKVYLSPCALGPLAVMAQMVAAGGALPLVGGRLALAACEIAIRDAAGVTRTTAPLTEARDWAVRLGGAIAARVDRLLDALSRPPHAARGEPLAKPLIMGIVNATPDSFS